MDSQEITSKPRVWIHEVTFSDGTKVTLKPDDIVVLVGPNNSGKSVALKNIEQKAKEKTSSTVVVTSVKLAVEGDQSQLCKWLERNSRKNIRSPSNPVFTRMGASVSESQAKSWWTDYGNGLHELARFFVCLLTTDARLGAASMTILRRRLALTSGKRSGRIWLSTGMRAVRFHCIVECDQY